MAKNSTPSDNAQQDNAQQPSSAAELDKARVIDEIIETFKENQYEYSLTPDNVIQTSIDGVPFFVEVAREDDTMPLYVMVSSLVSLSPEAEEIALLNLANEMNLTFATGKMRIYNYENPDGSIGWNALLSVAETEQTIEDFAPFFTSAFNMVHIMIATLISSNPDLLLSQDAEETSSEQKD